MAAAKMPAGPIALARYLALAWSLVLIYASLHPFSGWRDVGVEPWAFLTSPWPRYWTSFDLISNVLVYLPLGFLLMLAWSVFPRKIWVLLLALLSGSLLSFVLEMLQSWLPSRVPSNLDLLCNTLGTLLGALLATWCGRDLLGRIAAWEKRVLAPVGHAELGLTLLGLWLFIPLSPEILLFAGGDFRHLIGDTGFFRFSVSSYPVIESTVIGANVVLMGLLMRWLTANLWLSYVMVFVLLWLGLVVRTVSAAVLLNPAEAFSWLTAGAQTGLAYGFLILLVLLPTPAWLRKVLAILTVLLSIVLVNVTPANPYSAAALAAWQQGHFLNFNGLTRWIASLWPFLTFGFFILSRGRP